MKITYKILCFMLSLVLLISIGCVTIYAEPDDSGNVQPPDSSVTSTVDPPASDNPPADNQPQEPIDNNNNNNNNQYDNNNNNSGDYNNNNYDYNNGDYDNSYDFTDDNQSTDNSFDFTQNDSNNSNQTSGYTDIDGNWVPYEDNEQYDNYTEDNLQDEDPTETTLYNVSGNIDTDTLSSDDWKLDLNVGGANGTENFNFIKNNNSRFDSNFSIMLLYGGIALIVISIVIMSLVIYKSVQGRKKAAINRVPFSTSGNNKTKSKHTSSKNRGYYRKSDTAEINIKNKK